jgi:tetratricopeptide (TPR) repeat protein
MSRLSSLALIIAVFLAGPAARSDTPGTAEEFFVQGVARHQAGDILGAIEAYRSALDKEPGRIDARSNLGAAYVRLGRYQDAVEQYRKALEAEPRQANVRFNLALALYKSALVIEAAAELEAVVAQDAGNTSALLLLADCQLQLGQDARVVALLSPHERALGGDRLYAYLLGSALLRRNELVRGQALIDRLFRGGDTAEGRLLLAAAHMQRRDAKSALPEVQRAIELNPKLQTLHSLYGRALMQTGRRQEAADAFRTELEGNPNDFDSNLYLGLILKEDKRLDESYDLLKRAGRLRPQDISVLYGLGSLHLAADRVEEAQKALEVVTREAPDYAQGHVLLATVYYRQKKKAEGDREAKVVEMLKEKRQAQQPGSSDDLGPAYRGEDTPPRTATPAPEASTKKAPSRPSDQQ